MSITAYKDAVLALSPTAFWPDLGADASTNSQGPWVNGNANSCSTNVPGMLFNPANSESNTSLDTDSAASTYRKFMAKDGVHPEIDILDDLYNGPITLIGLFSSLVTTGWSILLETTNAGGNNASTLIIRRNYGNDPKYFAVEIYDSAGNSTRKIFSDSSNGFGPWRTGEKVLWHLRIDAGFGGSGDHSKIRFGFDGVDLVEAGTSTSNCTGTFVAQTSNARWLLNAYPFNSTTDTLLGGLATHQGLAYWAGVALTDSQLEDIIAAACYSVGGVGLGLNNFGDYDPAADANFSEGVKAETVLDASGYGLSDLTAAAGEAPVWLTDPLGRKCLDFRSVNQNTTGRQTCLEAASLTIHPMRMFQFVVAGLTSHACDTSYDQGRFLTTHEPVVGNDRYCSMVAGRSNGVFFNGGLLSAATTSMVRGIPSLSVFGFTTGGDGRLYATVPKFVMDNGAVVVGSGPTAGTLSVHTNVTVGAFRRFDTTLSQDSFCGRLYRLVWGNRPLSATAIARLRDYLASTYEISNQRVPVTVWGTSIECAHNMATDALPTSNDGWVQDYAPERLQSRLDLVNCATGNATLNTIYNLDPSLTKWYMGQDGVTLPTDPIVIIEPFTNNIYAGTSVNDQWTTFSTIVGKIRTACPAAKIVVVYMPLDDGANGNTTIRDDLHVQLVANPDKYTRLVVIPSGQLSAWVHPSTAADAQVISDAVWGVVNQLVGGPNKLLLLLDSNTR